jgi:ABC-type transporter Mla MlaB component
MFRHQKTNKGEEKFTLVGPTSQQTNQPINRKRERVRASEQAAKEVQQTKVK